MIIGLIILLVLALVLIRKRKKPVSGEIEILSTIDDDHTGPSMTPTRHEKGR